VSNCQEKIAIFEIKRFRVDGKDDDRRGKDSVCQAGSFERNPVKKWD
jgi:hypothetical protein